MFKTRLYPLRRSRRILRSACSLYRRKYKTLSAAELQRLEDLLARLDQAVLGNDRVAANGLAREVEEVVPELFRKGILEYVWEVGGSLVLALIVAVIVRQMWFEPMEIPSGSMRPTFQELDRLLASKTNFGLNIPLTTGHFYFNPDLVERTGVFIFTAEGMDIPDQDTRNFLIFPAKRRLIKRCMGKPGDTLYFYGGKIYGVDRDGKELTELRDAPWMEGIDSVPFITFDGKGTLALPNHQGVLSPVYIQQMNQKIARLSVLGNGSLRGEVYDGKRWIADDPSIGDDSVFHTYAQRYGMRNYAMARLLTHQEVVRFSEDDLVGADPAELYLELRHDPSLTYPKPRLARDVYGNVRPVLTPEVSLIPLDSAHLNTLMRHMYTARFIVEGGRARPDRSEGSIPADSPYSPPFSGIPDGRYQFCHGKAYKVAFGGILEELPSDHPLYEQTPANIQRLFNLGMEFNTLFSPQGRDQPFYPRRYAFYREGALFVMGKPVFQEDDPALMAFVQREKERAAASSRTRPYQPFIDHGPPLLSDGSINIGFIQTFGLHIPEKGYLALGDNYAGSADSREFGFVPQANIQGAPAEILWPPGSRWGPPKQKPYPLITGPRITVWAVAIVCIGGYLTYRGVRNRRPTFRKKP